MNVDVLVDVQRGDCGKGKISKVLNENGKYKWINKFNGGGNAGHAVWIGESKYTAHYLTSGLYYPDTQVMIGPGCVLNPEEFLAEVEMFKDFNVKNRVWIHPNVHIIQKKHLEIDGKDTKIGTTKKGIGPCYSDKYNRTGIRAKDVSDLRDFIPEDVDTMIWLMMNNVLMEGSQGWWLDIDHGNYPYVTSSHIHPAFAFATFGIPMRNLGKVYGVAKIYETYVGNANGIVQGDEDFCEAVREVGKEYGETTGRPRKVGYLNLDELNKAVYQTGIDVLYINKTDVLQEVGKFPINFQGAVRHFGSLEELQNYVETNVKYFGQVKEVYFSGTKDGSDLITG